MGIIQIATIAETATSVLKPIVRFGAEKVYLLPVNDDLGKNTAKKTSDELRTMGVKTATKPLDHLDMPLVTKTVRELIQKIKEEDPESKIYINITSGRKTAVIATLLATYFEATSVDKIFYWQNNHAIEIPILNIPPSQVLSKEKLALMHLLEEKAELTVNDIDEYYKKTKNLEEKSIPVIHQHLRELRDLNFVQIIERQGKKNVYALTDAGRMLL